jgi:hypothetical protein
MPSWAEIVKATAHIPIPPPAVSLPKPTRKVLRLGGKEYAVYKAKKQKEKIRKEEQRKKIWAEEEIRNTVEKEESEVYYTNKLEEYFPEEFAEYSNATKAQSAKDLYEELMGADCEDEMQWEEDEMPWEDDPYEKQEKEARRRAMFLHSMGDYEGVYKIATRYYFI